MSSNKADQTEGQANNRQLATRFKARLVSNTDLIEKVLDQLLQAEPLTGETVRPAHLLEAMRHGVLGGGKRLRPFLLTETATLFGISASEASFAGAALECLHSYSLIHDDLPAMDNDKTRRGKPTVHVAFGHNTAILAGDALLTLSFDILSREETSPDPQKRSELVLLLARAAGLGGMVGGQMLDLAAEQSASSSPEETVTLQAMKTGALFRFACEAGAVLGGADPGERRTLVRYGELAGRLFQIADDILDVEGDEVLIGKKTAKDADKNKATLIKAYGLEETKRLRDQLLEETLELMAPFGEQGQILCETARFICHRDH